MNIILIFLLSTVLNAQTTLTQTVGTSAFQVVTSREVKATEMIAKSLEKEMKDNVNLQLSHEGAGRTLFEIAIYRESQSLAAIKPDADEIANLVSVVKTRLAKNLEWKKLDITDAEIKTWVERKKVATEYMKLKASSLTTIVTDQEIRDYYEKNRVKFGSTPLEDQKANIKLFLQKESQKLRVQEWMSALRTKYQIRNDLADIGAESEISTKK